MEVYCHFGHALFKLHWLQWLVSRKDASFISHIRWISLTGHNNGTPGIVFSECKSSHSPRLETQVQLCNGKRLELRCVCVRACPTKKNLQLYIAGETLKLREKSDTLEIHTWVRAYVPPPPPLTVTTGKLSLPRGAHHYHKHRRLDPYSQYSSCK